MLLFNQMSSGLIDKKIGGLNLWRVPHFAEPHFAECTWSLALCLNDMKNPRRKLACLLTRIEQTPNRLGEFQ